MKPNAGAHLPPEAEATQERRLEAVRCSALFGPPQRLSLHKGFTSGLLIGGQKCVAGYPCLRQNGA